MGQSFSEFLAGLMSAILAAYIVLTTRTGVTAGDCHAVATMLVARRELDQALVWVERGTAIDREHPRACRHEGIDSLGVTLPDAQSERAFLWLLPRSMERGNARGAISTPRPGPRCWRCCRDRCSTAAFPRRSRAWAWRHFV